MSHKLRHSPSKFVQLRRTLFAFAAQANPNAGCKFQIGESRKCQTGLPVSPRKKPRGETGNDNRSWISPTARASSLARNDAICDLFRPSLGKV